MTNLAYTCDDIGEFTPRELTGIIVEKACNT